MKYVDIGMRATGKTMRAIANVISLIETIDEPTIVFISNKINVSNNSLQIMSRFINDEIYDDVTLISICARNINEVKIKTAGLDKESTILIFDEFYDNEIKSESDVYAFFLHLQFKNLLYVAYSANLEEKSNKLDIHAFKLYLDENIMQSRIIEVTVPYDYFENPQEDVLIFKNKNQAYEYLNTFIKEKINSFYYSMCTFPENLYILKNITGNI